MNVGLGLLNIPGFLTFQSSSATWKTNLVVKDFLCLILFHTYSGMKYQFFEKVYDMINKMYTLKFENLTIFIAFPLPPMETGSNLN